MSTHYALIGENISYSKSPKIHTYMSKKLNIEFTYDLLDVSTDELAALIMQMRHGYYQGFNVTIPHKETIIDYIDILTDQAKKIHAVNTIYMKDGIIIGDNTDYDGFFGLLQFYHIDVNKKRVYILGSGGAAKAIYHVLKDLNAEVTVVSRSQYNDNLSFERIIGYQHIHPKEVDIYVHATPVGTFPHVTETVLEKEYVENQIVIDLVYHPEKTQIMKDSKQGIGGILMLIIQALKSEEIWFQRKIELHQHLIEELKEVICSE